jgi:hypothetical protein
MGLAELKALALDLGGLVHGHDFQEAAGTTLDDFSASGLDSTLVVGRYTLNQAALLDGASGSLAYAVVNSAVASRAVASGSPLQTPTSFTEVMVVQPNAYGANRTFIERSGNWYIRQAASGQLLGGVSLGGVFQTAIQTYTTIVTGQPAMIAMWYEDGWLEFVINGAPEVKNTTKYVGSLNTSSTGQVTFGGSSTANTRIQFHGYFNRRLSYGELTELAEEAGSAVTRTGGVYFDFVQDEIPVVAATDHVAYCHVTGGKMREGEAHRTPSGGRRRQSVMRAVELLGSPTLDASSTEEDWAARAIEHFMEVTMHVSFVGNTTRKVHSEAGGVWFDDLGNSTTDANYGGLGATAATIARYLAGSPRGKLGLVSPDPFIQFARHSLDFYFSHGDGPLGGYWFGDDFATAPLSAMVMDLEGLIPEAEHQEIVEKYMGAIDFYWSGGTDLRGVTHGNEYSWYINGNRECGEHLGFLAGYRYDPVKWAPRLDDHWDRILSPPAGLGGAPSPGFGFVTTVAPTLPDGSDGKGYLRENHGGNQSKGFYNWGSVGAVGENEGKTKSGSYETIDVGGLSKEYLSLANHFNLRCMTMAKKYGLPGEERTTWLGNMLYNKLTDHLNPTSWVVDASYGSRHTTDFTLQCPVPQILTFAGARSDFDPDSFPVQWAAMETAVRGVLRFPNSSGLWRDMPWRVGTLLTSLETFPGS